MKVCKRLSLCLVLLALLPVHALYAAQSVRFLTAGDLYFKFSSERLEDQLVGQHYLMGVLDGLALAKDPRLCIGTSLQINELVVIVRQQLVSRPDVHRFNAASVVREALIQRFPCA